MVKPKFNQSLVVAKGDSVSYESHSTQVNLDSKMLKVLQHKIPENTVYRELPQVKDDWGNLIDNPEEEYGYENQAHVTILYGMQDENDFFAIKRILMNTEPPELVIGKISSFRNPDSKFDVMKLDVHSPGLAKLHYLFADRFEHTNKFPEYKPHITLAYVKRNSNKEIEGKCDWTGTAYQVNTILFSHTDGYYLPMQVGKA